MNSDALFSGKHNQRPNYMRHEQIRVWFRVQTHTRKPFARQVKFHGELVLAQNLISELIHLHEPRRIIFGLLSRICVRITAIRHIERAQYSSTIIINKHKLVHTDTT